MPSARRTVSARPLRTPRRRPGGERRKARAFLRDCGDDPSYCMSERARTGRHGGADNPRYASVDAWSFSVALDRARAYYARRLAVEAPDGSSTEERARSACASASTPMRPTKWGAATCARAPTRSTRASRTCRRTRTRCAGRRCTRRRSTRRRSTGRAPRVVHGPDAPGRAGRRACGSIAQTEAGRTPMRRLRFHRREHGQGGGRLTSIDNGFEYHYEAVAQAAERVREGARGAGSAHGRGEAACRRLARRGGTCWGEVAACASRRPAGTVRRGGLVANTAASPPRPGLRAAPCTRRRARRAGGRVGRNAPGRPSDEGATVVSSLLDGVRGRAGRRWARSEWCSTAGRAAGRLREGQEALDDSVSTAWTGCLRQRERVGRVGGRCPREAVRARGSHRPSSTRSNRSS